MKVNCIKKSFKILKFFFPRMKNNFFVLIFNYQWIMGTHPHVRNVMYCQSSTFYKTKRNTVVPRKPTRMGKLIVTTNFDAR